MRMRVFGTLALAMVAGACAQQEQPSANAANEAAGVDYAQQIRDMPEGQRNGVFIRAIRDARLDCQHVESATAGPDYQGRPVWNVVCQGGGNWTIVIGDGGVAQILNANEARLVEPGNGQAPANSQ